MDPIAEWLIDNAISIQSLGEILEGICPRLVAEGLPMVRANLSLSIIDPAYRARTCTWRPDTGIEASVISHESDGKEFQQSPMRAMFEAGQETRHWLIDAHSRAEFPMMNSLAAIGATDYFVVMTPFSSPAFGGLRGVAFTVATNQPGSLTEAQKARIISLARMIAPIIYRMTLGDIAITLMDAYVGAPASRRILNGAVQRGSGEPIEAVLIMADLVGFTALADRSGLDLIERLDEHLGAMAEPVIARGGSVLKFMGDGMLAIFPVSLDVPKAEACSQALAAAREAIRQNDVINTSHPVNSELKLDIAINHGVVFYGNVGAPGRLDFTVIGPAVNEVSRMEAMCGQLGEHIIIAADVASELEGELRSLGRHRLRGIEVERELFAPGPDLPSGHVS